MGKIKVAIIGFGRIGQVHFKSLINHPNYQVTHVCDIKPASDFAEKFPAIKYVNDYREVLKDPAVEAVLIGTPTSLHPTMIIEAAKAKKHIFCEKPIGFEMTEIMKAYYEVKKQGVKFQLGFNRRFDDDFYQINQQLDKIGEKQILKITSRDPEGPPIEYVKQSGGLFMDMSIHDFDMARFMFGEVAEVFVSGAALIDPTIRKYGDIDTAIINLIFVTGALGVIDNSRQAVYGYDQRVEVFGEKGMLANSNHLEHNTVFSSNKDVAHEKPVYFFLERYAQSYATEQDFFAKSLLENAPIACTIEDGIMAVKIAQAAKESFESGKPVKVQAL